jgi:signal transduction histidine kinase
LAAAGLTTAVAAADSASAQALMQAAAVGRLSRESAAQRRPVRVEGVVVYADEAWQLAFVVDGSGAVFVDPILHRGALVPGTRVEVQGVTEWLRGGAGISPTDVRPVGRAEYPPAAPVSDPARPAGAGGRWVSVEGVVRRASLETGRAELRVYAAGTPLHVHIPAPAPQGLPGLVDAEVRLRGVLESRPGAALEPRLWVAGWSELTVLAAAPDPGSLPTTAIAEVKRLSTSHRVRIRGRVASRSSPRSFLVEDETGDVEVELQTPEIVQRGPQMDIWGFLDVREGRPVVVDTGYRLIELRATALTREPELPAVRSAAEVRALTRAEAARGHPVRLEAVVTYVDPVDNYFFVQDRSAGVFVYTGYQDLGVSPGTLVDLEGVTGPGDLAPLVMEPHVRSLGHEPLPPPRRVGAARFLSGRDDCHRVQVAGIVRSAERRDGRFHMVLEVESRRLPARLFPAPESLDPESLVDASVRITAVCATSANWRGQLQSAELFVGRQEDIEILQPPAAEPFALGVTPVSDVLRAGGESRWGHRVRVSGVVLHQSLHGRLFLRDRTGTLSATLLGSLPLFPGEQVGALGFPTPGPFAPVLEDAVTRIEARGAAPTALTVGVGELLAGTHEGDLVAVRARLQEVMPTDSGFALIVRSGETLFDAALEGEAVVPVSYEPGAVLDLVGIAVVLEEPGLGRRLRLVLRDIGDVRVLERPPWWTSRRVKWVLGGLVSVLLGASAWVVTLRKQVRATTRELQKRMEHESQVERQVRAQLEELVQVRSLQVDELRKRLVREERMAALGKITATVSHELRNPLATIRGSLYLIGEALKDGPSRLTRALERAERSIVRSNDIIEELIDYSRMRPLERTAIDVDTWLGQALADIAFPDHVELVRDLASGAKTEVDGPRLLRCIINLVTNAVEAIEGSTPPSTRSGSRVEVSTRWEGDRLEIRVVDDGPGIPAESREQIFEPFFSTKRFGVGLGLPIVRQIAEQHGGGVDVVSQPGRTAFTLWIPLGAKPAEAAG